MKRIFYFLFLFTTAVHAKETKGIRFTEGTWAQILTEARTQNKLIFVDIYTTWCGPCKVMDKNVFTNTEVGEKFNTSFINYKIDAEQGEGIDLKKKYAITGFPTYLFVNQEGELVYKSIGSMPAKKFLSEADKALQAGNHYKSTAALEEDFKSGRRDAKFLYEFLERKKLNGEQNDGILEEYLKAIPESAQKTEKVLMIISENIGSIDSKAFDILRNSLDRFMNMTPEQQKFVLEGISKAKRGTFKKAIETKDNVLFERLISAVRQTAYSEAGFEAEERQFRLDFAKITRDANNFRMIASKEGAKLLEKTNEQLAAESQLKTERFIQAAKAKGIKENTMEYLSALEDIKTSAQKLTSFHLNEYAWGYFQLIESKDELETALKWSERSIELFKSPVNLDTYANLLSKLGRRKEAIKAEKGAIKLAKKQGIETKELKLALKEMKKR
ncbi:thioredoxin family protein [Emticicia sp. C21]|uniref:thioredoxin family protein n=1 Tax=Emticicia sp. C21 TaxID=2302915 RepID=UPI0013142A5F|nr:thioredoxin family protein [Emticicia sp. C21]